MPNRNGMGPMGKGSRTGRGFGNCHRGNVDNDFTLFDKDQEKRERRFRRKNTGRGMRFVAGTSLKKQKEHLEMELHFITEQLKQQDAAE